MKEAASAGPVRSLYVHVPFCARKCTYCAFYSEASEGALIQRYVEALVQDLERVAPCLRPQTVFFGGGTPSLLNLRQWRRLFAAMDRLGLLGAGEWTIESNPATVSEEKAHLWHDHGVSRVSMGVQSLDDALLDRLGRVHTRDMVFRSFDALRRAGFDNLNLDLMFAIPGQTLNAWRRTLTEAISMGSEHLSCYEVIYEEDTPLFQQRRSGEAVEDEDLACAMHEELLVTAGQEGLLQYEVANFARNAGAAEPAQFGGVEPLDPGPSIPTHACRHNINYWMGGTYLGLGPGACSFVGGMRSRVLGDTAEYCGRLEQGRPPQCLPDVLAPRERAGEIAAFGLRMNAGWSLDRFRQVTGHDLLGAWGGEVEALVRQGWGVLTPDRFRLTPQGLRFADAAGQRFLG